WTLVCLFLSDPAILEIYSLSLHDALPICGQPGRRSWQAERKFHMSLGGASCRGKWCPLTAACDWCPQCLNALATPRVAWFLTGRSEEHTSELQSRENLVCRLLLEKKKK